jgi:hypothetical protein
LLQPHFLDSEGLTSAAAPALVFFKSQHEGANMASRNPTRQVTHLAIVLLVTFIATADNTSNTDLRAFAGTWQEDLSKTVRTPPDETRKYEQNPDGTMSATLGTNDYHDTFRIDGKLHPEVPRPDVMQTWTQTGPSTWESTEGWTSDIYG